MRIPSAVTDTIQTTLSKRADSLVGLLTDEVLSTNAEIPKMDEQMNAHYQSEIAKDKEINNLHERITNHDQVIQRQDVTFKELRTRLKTSLSLNNDQTEAPKSISPVANSEEGDAMEEDRSTCSS